MTHKAFENIFDFVESRIDGHYHGDINYRAIKSYYMFVLMLRISSAVTSCQKIKIDWQLFVNRFVTAANG